MSHAITVDPQGRRIPRGGAAAIGIKGGSQYALSADVERDGALLHFTKVSGPVPTPWNHVAAGAEHDAGRR